MNEKRDPKIPLNDSLTGESPIPSQEIPHDTLGAKVKQLSASQKKVLRDQLLAQVLQKARDDFYVYVKMMAPVVMRTDYIDGAHIKVICEKLMAVERGEIKFLQIHMPPGSMKTVLTNNLFASWYLGRHSTHKVISVGHGTEFAEDKFGRPVRDLISTSEFKAIFPGIEVRYDVKAAGRWYLTQGGEYLATGQGTDLAGYRYHIGIADDIVSEQDAYSKIKRDKINEWWYPGFESRGLPESAVILVNTRWHMEDISGYLEAIAKKIEGAPQWHILRIPAILGAKSAKFLKMREGESFWPEFWPTKRFQEIKATRTRSVWQALYMQNPVADEGNIIQKKHFKVWELKDPPTCSYVIMTLDTAFSTKTTADFSVMQLWGVFNRSETGHDGKEYITGHMILLDNKFDRWDFPTLAQKTREWDELYRPDLIIIEKKASGQSLIQEMRKQGRPVFEYVPDRDKVSRVHAATAVMEAGRIWVPRKTWVNDLLNEAFSFPNGAHDDQVDAMTQAILWMRDMWKVEHPRDPREEPEIGYTRPKTWLATKQVPVI